MPLTGPLREVLTLQRNVHPVLAVTALTQAAGVAAGTVGTPHGFATSDYVTVAGAVPDGYNGRVQLSNIPSATQFAYGVSPLLASPATGTITVQYFSDGSGGRKDNWTTFATVRAERMLTKNVRLNASSLQLETVRSGIAAYQFCVRARVDLAIGQRVLWTPIWPQGAASHTLEIVGLTPDDNVPVWLMVDCDEILVPA